MPDLRTELVDAARARVPAVRRRRVGPAVVVLVATCALVIVLVVGALDARQPTGERTSDGERASHAVAQPSAPGTPPPGARGGVATSSARATERVRTVFAVFRTPDRSARNPFDLVMPEIRDGDGIDRASARRLDLPGYDVWVAAGRLRGAPSLCLRAASTLGAGGTAGTCAPLSVTRTSGGLFMSSRPAPDDVDADKLEWYGVVPDGIGTMTLTFADGTTRDVEVHDNAVAGVFASSPRSIAYTDRAGRRRTHRF